MMSLRFSSASFPDASTDEVFDDRQPSAGDCQDQLDDGFSRLVRAGFHVIAKRAGEVVTANEVLKVRLSNEADQPQATVQVSEAKSNSVNTCRLKSVDVLLMANKFTEIQLDVGKEVRMETLTINEILKTVENVIVAKLDWSRAEEIDRLKAEKEELERILEEEKKYLSQQLEVSTSKFHNKLKEQERRHSEEREQDHVKFKKFVLRLATTVELVREILTLLAEKLPGVVRTLVDKFNVRLQGVTAGLSFLMDIPVNEWDNFKNRQQEMQDVLFDLVPEDKKREVKWEMYKPTLLDLDFRDLEVGEPMPVTEMERLNAMATDMCVIS